MRNVITLLLMMAVFVDVGNLTWLPYANEIADFLLIKR